MKELFNLLLFKPLYNLLVLVTGFLPSHDLGLAIVILTLVVKLALLPLQHRALKTQRQLKALDGEIKKLKTQHAAEPQVQAQAMMALYREHGINPFGSFLLLFIQIPIILALFFVFKESWQLAPENIYSFVALPENLNTEFLGLIDVTRRSFWLALLVGVSQFFQLKLSLPALPETPTDKSQTLDFKTELARSWQLQMRYVMPVFIVFIAFGLPAAISVYWLTSNLFALGHELFVKRRADRLLAGR